MKHHLDQEELECFDPVVDDWNKAAQEQELRERETCDFCLYVMTPKMTGTYAIAEVVDDSNKQPDKTVLVLLRDDEEDHFNDGQWKSLVSVLRMVERNGAVGFDNLKSAAVHMGVIARNREKEDDDED